MCVNCARCQLMAFREAARIQAEHHRHSQRLIHEMLFQCLPRQMDNTSKEKINQPEISLAVCLT